MEADNKSANLEATIVKEEAVPLLAPDFKVDSGHPYLHTYSSLYLSIYTICIARWAG